MTTRVESTHFYDGANSPPTSSTKEISPGLVSDCIREFLLKQYRHLYSVNPTQQITEKLVNGFILFNLSRNTDMLKNKRKLNGYLNDTNISGEEITYFLDIVLQIQKPYFLTQDEIESIRALGTLDCSA